MIGEGDFDLLKAGGKPPETVKRAEIALTCFPTILLICRQEVPDQFPDEAVGFPRARAKHPSGLNAADFRWIWLIRCNLAFLLFGSQN